MEKYLAKVEFEQGEHKVDIIRKINEDEIDFLSTLGEPVHKYYHLKEIYQMAVDSGRELEQYLVGLKNKIESNGKEVHLKGNRLIANYCFFIGMFIDYVEKVFSSYGKREQELFSEYCRNLYDTSFEYRFIVRLRNYITHYAFPFSVFQKTFEGTTLKMGKQHLLEFKKWNTVREDIERLDEEIDFKPFIYPMNINLTTMLLEIQYIMAPIVLDKFEELSEFRRANNIIHPALVQYQDIEAFKEGKFNMTPFIFDNFIDFIKEIEQNPKIKLKFK